MTSLDRLHAPKERPLFILGAIFSACVWLVLIVTLVGLIYGLFIGLAVLFAHAVYLAQVRGNGVRLSEQQLPELYERCVKVMGRLGLDRLPEVYVVQSGGILNAFATKLLSRRYIILLSDLVDGCQDPRQLDFIVGHELGHFAAGHLRWNTFLLPFRLLPWFGPAYSRACEYTCDRYGLEAVGELEPSLRGLAVLAAGGKQAMHVNLQAFMAQREESGDFWMAVTELCSSHPFLCKRVAALVELQAPGTVRPVSRNVFAWPLAPLLGFSGGAGATTVMVMVAWVGIMAAIAIPNFQKFQERARAQAAARQMQALPPSAFDAQEDEALPEEAMPGEMAEEEATGVAADSVP